MVELRWGKEWEMCIQSYDVSKNGHFTKDFHNIAFEIKAILYDNLQWLRIHTICIMWTEWEKTHTPNMVQETLMWILNSKESWAK